VQQKQIINEKKKGVDLEIKLESLSKFENSK